MGSQRDLSVAGKVGLVAYEVIIVALQIILWPLLPLLPVLRRQVQARSPHTPKILENLTEMKCGRDCVVFYCSSAGELEQAIPLIDTYSSRNLFVHVFFHSISGLLYAEKIKLNASFSLAPIDRTKNWKPVLAVLKPVLTIVVRNELWPIFLVIARRYGKLVIMDLAVCKSRSLALWSKQRMLRLFDHVFAVSPAAVDQHLLKHIDVATTVTGESKFDRVFEKQQSRSRVVADLEDVFTVSYGNKRKLIVGSALRSDVLISLDAFSQIEDENWQLIIVPHEIDEPYLHWIISETVKRQMSWSRFTKHDLKRPDVIILDTIGMLFDAYGCADLAYIGGGFDSGVHNVAEATIYQIPVAFGPHYADQFEAVELVRSGLATSIRDVESFRHWWQTNSSVSSVEEMGAFMQEKRGASARILTILDGAMT